MTIHVSPTYIASSVTLSQTFIFTPILSSLFHRAPQRLPYRLVISIFNHSSHIIHAMHFSTMVSLVLSFAALSIASPYPHPVPETAENIERGLVYNPRSSGHRANSNNVIIITKTKEEQLTEVSRGREIQLTKLVQERLVIIDQTQIARDNVRRNHFRNLNSQRVRSSIEKGTKKH